MHYKTRVMGTYNACDRELKIDASITIFLETFLVPTIWSPIVGVTFKSPLMYYNL